MKFLVLIFIVSTFVTITTPALVLNSEERCSKQQIGKYSNVFNLSTNIKPPLGSGLLIADQNVNPAKMSIQYQVKGPQCLNIISIGMRIPRSQVRENHPCGNVTEDSGLRHYFSGNVWKEELPKGGEWTKPGLDLSKVPWIVRSKAKSIAEPLMPSIRNVDFDLDCGTGGRIEVQQGGQKFEMSLLPVKDANGNYTGAYTSTLIQSDKPYEFTDLNLQFEEDQSTINTMLFSSNSTRAMPMIIKRESTSESLPSANRSN